MLTFKLNPGDGFWYQDNVEKFSEINKIFGVENPKKKPDFYITANSWKNIAQVIEIAEKRRSLKEMYGFSTNLNETPLDMLSKSKKAYFGGRLTFNGIKEVNYFESEEYPQTGTLVIKMRNNVTFYGRCYKNEIRFLKFIK